MSARVSAGVFVSLLVVSACSGSVTETTATTATIPAVTTTGPPATTTTALATTTTVPAPTTTLAPDVPYPDLTIGDDPVQLWLNIMDFFNWMEQHPDPELVTVIFHEDAPRTAELQEFYRNFTALGYHYSDPGVEVLSVLLNSQTDTMIVLESVDRRGDQIVTNEDGTEAGIEPGWEPKVTEVSLRLGDDGRWRIADTMGLREATSEDLEREPVR